MNRIGRQTASNAVGNDIVDRPVFPWLFDAEKLLMAGPQVQKKSDGREPEIIRAHTHLHCAVIKKSSKGFRISLLTLPVYSTSAFFKDVSSSLSTLRLVPGNMASVMAFLYAAKSSGEVRNSTSSSVSKSSGASLFLRLWMRMD